MNFTNVYNIAKSSWKIGVIDTLNKSGVIKELNARDLDEFHDVVLKSGKILAFVKNGLVTMYKNSTGFYGHFRCTLIHR